MNELDFKRLSDLAKKFQLFDMLIAVEYSKLFLGEKNTIRINESLQNYKRISKFFVTHDIPFESYTPSHPPSRFDIHFGNNIDFQDLFIVSVILKNFGLQSIFFTNDCEKEILIGSHITEAKDGSQKRIDDGIAVEKLLEIPFQSTLEHFLKERFGIEIETFPDFEEEDYDFYDPHDNYDPSDEYGTSYEKYGGYNGYSDDVIDDAFEGDPSNTWNVD